MTRQAALQIPVRTFTSRDAAVEWLLRQAQGDLTPPPTPAPTDGD
jgi:hypothetical protein